MTDKKECNVRCCRVNCQVGGWGKWGKCTEPCGGGTQRRYRKVLKAPTIEKECKGTPCAALEDSRKCNLKPKCPCTATISAWTDWSACNAPCNQWGQTIRTRTLEGSKKKDEACPYSSETKRCWRPPCPTTDCKLAEWSAWGACNQKCGTGTQYRLKAVARYPMNGGKACPAADDELRFESSKCNTQGCPSPPCGKVGLWNSWGKCSVTCGEGTAKRTRTVVKSTEKGAPCATGEETKPCFVTASGSSADDDGCRPDVCLVGPWNSWTKCSQKYGTGEQTRRREIKQNPGPGAKACPNLVEAKKCKNPPIKPPECEPKQWGRWSACSATCESNTQGGAVWGISSRKRKLAQPKSVNCPVDISGEETRQCSVFCPCNCKMSKWGVWSKCSVSCGVGSQVRSRKVEVEPCSGGTACGPKTQTKQCGGVCPCPKDVSLSGTSLTIEMTVIKNRKTTKTYFDKQYTLQKIEDAKWAQMMGMGCKHQSYVLAGSHKPFPKNCPANSSVPFTTIKLPYTSTVYVAVPDMSDINALYGVSGFKRSFKVNLWSGVTGQMWEKTLPCGEYKFRNRCGAFGLVYIIVPNNCCESEVGSWTPFSQCSNTCGWGVRTRTREIKKASYTIKSSGCGISTNEKEKCFDRNCPVDCIVSAWGPWSKKCSQPCDGGSRYRERAIKSPAENGGQKCPKLVDQVTCNTKKCKPDCPAGPWSSWTPCSKKCGSSKSSRTRALSAFSNETPTFKDLGAGCCRNALGGYPRRYYLKSSSAGCKKACAGSRDCYAYEWIDVKHTSLTGAPGTCCLYLSAGKKPSGSGWRPQGPYGSSAKVSTASGCSNSGTRCILKTGPLCPDLKSDEAKPCITPCKQDCLVSAWSSWQACTATCGSGTRRRTRSISRIAKNGGKECPKLHEDGGCSKGCCPQNCKLSGEWSAWSKCDQPCQGGKAISTRDVIVKWKCGGMPCGPRYKYKQCDSPCPPGCLVTSWTAWSACSETCGWGQILRTRHVNGGAAKCGTPIDSKPCFLKKCEVDCKMNAWTKWGACSSSCGPAGVRTRSRTVAVAPKHGGLECGDKIETGSCQSSGNLCCPTDCVLKEWNDWGVCSEECGGGISQRKREVHKPAECGGKKCAAVLQERKCNVKKCPPCKQLSAWSAWSKCGCGHSEQKRTRTVSGCTIGKKTEMLPASAEVKACVGASPCNLRNCTMGGSSFL